MITLAKQAPERAWLGEVASVPLVQACQDARRAYRNWFDSLSGKRKGRTVGHPRFRSRKDHRQSIRLTRNGFARHRDRLYVAKVGDVKVRWSRPLPSVPSSLTIIGEADGRYYASFVVEVAATPLPAVSSDAGLDLGLSVLAATSDGELIANPRHLRHRERTLARAQRALCRTQKGSANRAKARVRVAVQHRKVGEARADHLHKTALRLIRDNQAVYVEDLNTAGMSRRPALKPDPDRPGAFFPDGARAKAGLNRSVTDAGWAALVRLLEEKAARYGRHSGQGGPLVPLQPALLSVRGEGRPETAARPYLDLRGVRGAPRPGRERGPQHPPGRTQGRRRAGGDPKRLRRDRKTRACPGRTQ